VEIGSDAPIQEKRVAGFHELIHPCPFLLLEEKEGDALG
jgi:hypothetical protein